MVTTSPPLPFMDLSVPLPDISAEALRHVSSLFPHLPYAPGEQGTVERVVLEISKQAKLGFTCVWLRTGYIHSTGAADLSPQFILALRSKGLMVQQVWRKGRSSGSWVINRRLYESPHFSEFTVIFWGKPEEAYGDEELLFSEEEAKAEVKRIRLWAESDAEAKGPGDWKSNYEMQDEARSSPTGCLPILVACGLGIFYFL